MIIHEEVVPKENSDDILLVRKVYFPDKSKVLKGDEIIELETSKTAIIITSKFDGYIQNLCNEGDEVKVAEAIFRIHDESNFKVNSKTKNKNTTKEAFSYSLSKSAIEFIEKNQLDISNLELQGLISLKKLKSIISLSETQSKEKNNKINELKNISFSKANEIKALEAVNKSGLVSNVKVLIDYPDINSFNLSKEVIFESSRLLKKYPLLNSYYDDGSIIVYDRINIGFAADIDDGLKVLVVHDADKMTYKQIESNTNSLIDKYLHKKLEPKDVTNSTFTITDLSQYSINSFYPLVNQKQAAMLGISSVNPKTSQVEISVSFDHRVTEGKYVAEFLSDLNSRIFSHNQNKLGKEKCFLCNKTLQDDLKLQGFGLIKILKHDSHEDYICSSCFSGW